jgi:phosphate transport system substrate-binding protein
MTLALGSLLALAACTGSSPNPSAGAGVEGFVSIHGSSTVEPISSNVAEKFGEENADFDFEVGDEGTSDGFALFFCTGDADINDASSAINEEQIAQCEDAGVEYTELLIAYDGLSVITSVDNADISCLSFLDIYALLGPESEGFTSWSDADALATELETELGGEFGESHAPYPDAELMISGPGEESGTFASFNDLVIEAIGEARGLPEDDWVVRPDYTSSSNDNDIVTGISGSPSSLGWVGLHFAEENADTIKAIEVDGGDGCVAPNTETVSDKSYPISRPLFLYVNNEKAASNAAVVPFVDYYLTDAGLLDSVVEEGYVPLPDSDVESTRSTWEAM